MSLAGTLPSVVLQLDWLAREGTRASVFSRIYWVFTVLGTIVGVVVIGYMLYNAWKYRDDGSEDKQKDRPELGELPEGGGKGKKLFLSFALSAIIVLSLIVWTYSMLLYVEAGSAAPSNVTTNGENPLDSEGPMVVDVEGYRFGWLFEYSNGYSDRNTLVVPVDTRIQLNVTSQDVIHNFGIPAQRVKSDAIPGETTRTWFEAEETGTYQALCYELCGAGHSYMNASVKVVSKEEFRDWYANKTAAQMNTTSAEATESGTETMNETSNTTTTEGAA